MRRTQTQKVSAPLSSLWYFSGAPKYRISDVAEALGSDIGKLGPVRARIIKKGMIYSPSHGGIAFTVPLFSDFIRRAMPDF